MTEREDAVKTLTELLTKKLPFKFTEEQETEVADTVSDFVRAILSAVSEEYDVRMKRDY